MGKVTWLLCEVAGQLLHAGDYCLKERESTVSGAAIVVQRGYYPMQRGCCSKQLGRRCKRRGCRFKQLGCYVK